MLNIILIDTLRLEQHNTLNQLLSCISQKNYLKLLKNMDNKLNLKKITICSVNKFTQACKILHNRWLRWL